jgi:DNA helicase-2/ATP-dependent DNA helicase PcrA
MFTVASSKAGPDDEGMHDSALIFSPVLSSHESDRARLLIGLTSDQEKAIVMPIAHPLAIVAGAGTGKTFTLVRKAEYMANFQGCDPNTMLALTFSRKACAELRSRFSVAGLRSVSCLTFHSFALKV